MADTRRERAGRPPGKPPGLRPLVTGPTAAFAAALLGALAVALLASACSAGPAYVIDGARLSELAARRGLDPAEVAHPFLLDDEMREWLTASVSKKQSFDRRLDTLLAALVSPEGRRIRYDRGHTGTAREVFATGEANCLGFTGLFVAMARELGVSAYFVWVDEVESYAEQEDLVVISNHVTAGVGPLHDLRILELGGDTPQGDYRAIHRIPDRTAIALYYSNRGAELLQAGDPRQGREALETAVKIDDELPTAWVNLGVVRRRSGDAAGAEAAYRRALDLDPGQVSAYQNLATLMRVRGETAAAAELLAAIPKIGSRNPYSYLHLGDWAMGRGEYEQAARWYRKALRMQRDAPQPPAALGKLALVRGDRAAAERWFARARRLDPEDPRVRELAGKL